jgi:hypothetical protein
VVNDAWGFYYFGYPAGNSGCTVDKKIALFITEVKKVLLLRFSSIISEF